MFGTEALCSSGFTMAPATEQGTQIARGVVQGHHLVHLEAEELVPISRPLPPGRLGDLTHHRELVVVAHQMLGQDLVGRLQGGPHRAAGSSW